MKHRYINETWQIINTFNRIRSDQQFNIVEYYTDGEDCYKLLKLTSLPFKTFKPNEENKNYNTLTNTTKEFY